jgi:CDP-diacylglycerol--glycerol-3-phosphate 3-phosphatidyltransferase
VLFGYANPDNQPSLFRYAGLVVFAAGFFDLVDGRVARASNQVTRFGAFFDSVLDRYSDAALFFGLLVYYSRINRSLYVVLAALVMISCIMVSYTRARSDWCSSLSEPCSIGWLPYCG